MLTSYFRDKMLQAYEFALDKVGLDFNSYQARVSDFSGVNVTEFWKNKQNKLFSISFRKYPIAGPRPITACSKSEGRRVCYITILNQMGLFAADQFSNIVLVIYYICQLEIIYKMGSFVVSTKLRGGFRNITKCSSEKNSPLHDFNASKLLNELMRAYTDASFE